MSISSNIFFGSDEMTPKIWPYSSLVTQNQQKKDFFFDYANFRLTVDFAILVGHIELQKLTESAGLQSYTMSYAE